MKPHQLMLAHRRCERAVDRAYFELSRAVVAARSESNAEAVAVLVMRDDGSIFAIGSSRLDVVRRELPSFQPDAIAALAQNSAETSFTAVAFGAGCVLVRQLALPVGLWSAA